MDQEPYQGDMTDCILDLIALQALVAFGAGTVRLPLNLNATLSLCTETSQTTEIKRASTEDCKRWEKGILPFQGQIKTLPRIHVYHLFAKYC